MPGYHIWTVGCQMNEADSERLASALEKMGHEHSPDIEEADIIVLNSCVVRQGVEDKVAGQAEFPKATEAPGPRQDNCADGVHGRAPGRIPQKALPSR